VDGSFNDNSDVGCANGGIVTFLATIAFTAMVAVDLAVILSMAAAAVWLQQPRK